MDVSGRAMQEQLPSNFLPYILANLKQQLLRVHAPAAYRSS